MSGQRARLSGALRWSDAPQSRIAIEKELDTRRESRRLWQQSSYAYRYRYAYSPKVIIYPSGSGYKMKVDGVDGDIAVIRLK